MTNELNWRKALRIAMACSGLNKDSAIVKTYAKRYNISSEALEILEQEAREESKKLEKCWKCGGCGYDRKWAEHLVLCDCHMSKRYQTIGPITYNTL